MLTANLGVLLAQSGQRVMIADLDLGAANLHTFIEQQEMGYGLDGFLNKDVPSLDRAVVPTRIPGLDFLNSVNCTIEIANLYAAQKEKIIRALRDLSYDYVFMDLGAGTHFNTLDFFLTSQRGFFIITPEPTSIENAFTFIKAVYSRILKRILKTAPFQKVARSLDLPKSDMARPFRTIGAVLRADDGLGRLLKEELKAYGFCFVINQLRRWDDPGLGPKIQQICNKYFYADFKFLGNIRHDEAIHEAIHMQEIFITRPTRTPGNLDLNQIARTIAEI
ncbi:MAG: hypothetical protein MI747_12330 [Desulfobacterales bacterium]|nr:hypothetical protein [Desulfobacterales bacterium]